MVITKQQMEQQAENKSVEEAELVTPDKLDVRAELVALVGQVIDIADKLAVLAREV